MWTCSRQRQPSSRLFRSQHEQRTWCLRIFLRNIAHGCVKCTAHWNCFCLATPNNSARTPLSRGRLRLRFPAIRAVGIHTFGVCATKKLRRSSRPPKRKVRSRRPAPTEAPRRSDGTGRRGPLWVAGRAPAASPTTGRMAQRPAFGGPGGGPSQHGARSSRWARHGIVWFFWVLGGKGPRSAAKWVRASGNEVLALLGRTGTGQCLVGCRLRLAVSALGFWWPWPSFLRLVSFALLPAWRGARGHRRVASPGTNGNTGRFWRPAHGTGQSTRQWRQWACTDSFCLFPFLEGVRRPVGLVAGSRAFSCVLAKLVGQRRLRHHRADPRPARLSQTRKAGNQDEARGFLVDTGGG